MSDKASSFLITTGEHAPDMVELVERKGGRMIEAGSLGAPDGSDQAREADWLRRFKTQIRSDLLSALVRQGATVARRGKLLTSLVDENASGAREAVFVVGRAEMYHEIRFTYQGNGQVSVDTGSQQSGMFTIAELNQKGIDRIAAEWLASLKL